MIKVQMDIFLKTVLVISRSRDMGGVGGIRQKLLYFLYIFLDVFSLLRIKHIIFLNRE